VAIVKDGGAVSESSIRARLDKAEKIAFIERNGNLVAVAAKKMPGI
jgi:hypothetical protein